MKFEEKKTRSSWRSLFGVLQFQVFGNCLDSFFVVNSQFFTLNCFSASEKKPHPKFAASIVHIPFLAQQKKIYRSEGKFGKIENGRKIIQNVASENESLSVYRRTNELRHRSSMEKVRMFFSLYHSFDTTMANKKGRQGIACSVCTVQMTINAADIIYI